MKAARGVALAVALACRLSLPAAAQDGAREEPHAGEFGREVEEIVVTATKRAENLQDVAIAVSAFDGEALRERGIDELADLAEVAPSLHVSTTTTTANGGTLRIRGVGTWGISNGLEAAVGTFIDGVYRSRSGHALSDLLDVERIEVLRGPQGTLFGKNTSAGALSILTKQPNLRELEGSVTGEYGSYDDRRLRASVSGPIVAERLGYRLAASWHRRDGAVADVHRNRSYNDRKRWAVRGNLLWESERSAARLIADFRQHDESCCQARWMVAGTTRPLVAALATSVGLGLDVPATIGADVSRQGLVGVTPGHEAFEDIKEGGISLELNIDRGWGRLTSLSAWRKFDARFASDLDRGSAALLNTETGSSGGRRDSFVTFSEELRAAGTAWEKFDWLVGVYGHGEDATFEQGLEFAAQGGLYQDVLVGAAFPALAPVSQAGHYPAGAGFQHGSATDGAGWAIFTHNNFRPAEKLELTLGARYSAERKRARVSLNGGVPGPIAGDPASLRPGQLRNDPTPAALGGATLPWCEQLSADGLGAVRRGVVQSFCDNVSWREGRREQAWSYTASLAYHVGEQVNVYVSFSRGTKAGGFNLNQDAVDLVEIGTPAAAIVDNSRVAPELADALEVGLKLTLWDGRARVNVAGFYTDFEDFQLLMPSGLGFLASNVNEVIARGAELEAFISPLEGLQLSLGVTHANARFGDDVNVCFRVQDPFGRINNCTPAGGVPGANDRPAGFFPKDFLIDGKRLANAPLFSASGSAHYERPLLRGWLVFGSLSVSFHSARNTSATLHPLAAETSHWLVNLRGGVRSPGGRWEMALWSTNLGDEFDRIAVSPTPLQAGTLHGSVTPPRMWGGTLRYAF